MHIILHPAIIFTIVRVDAIEKRETGKDVIMPPPLIVCFFVNNINLEIYKNKCSQTLVLAMQRSLFHQVLFGVAVALVVGLVAALIVGVSISGDETE